MRLFKNQDGFALVVSLMFVLVTLGMMLLLLELVMSSTRGSGAQARYRNSLEASYGGTEFVTKTVLPRLMPVLTNYSSGYLGLVTDFGGSASLGYVANPDKAALKQKLSQPTAAWSGLAMKSTDPKVLPDFTFTLKGASGSQDFTVYTKIVDTVPGVGLLDASGVDYLDAGLGVAGAGSTTQSPRTPNMYAIEVQGEKAVNPKEKANLSVLYAY